MVSKRFLATLSSILLVLGALFVGDALNGSLVAGAFGLLSSATLFRILPGLVLIWIGYRLRVSHAEYARSLPSEQTPTSEGKEEFDTEMSPLSEGDFDKLDRNNRDNP